jgi:hypothetical protein
MNTPDELPPHTCEIPDGLDDCDACRLSEIDADIQAGRNVGPLSPELFGRIVDLRVKAEANREGRGRTADALLDEIDDYLRDIIGQGLPHARRELRRIVGKYLTPSGCPRCHRPYVAARPIDACACATLSGPKGPEPHFRFDSLGNAVPCKPDEPGAMPVFRLTAGDSEV